MRADCKAFIDGVNEHEHEPARRMARGLCGHTVQALRDRLRRRFIACTLLDDLGLGSELNAGLVHDLSWGLAEGRLSALVLDAGVAHTLGITQALVGRIVGCTDAASAVVASQQMGTLLLRGFGVAAEEAETIASEAADQVVRLGAWAGS